MMVYNNTNTINNNILVIACVYESWALDLQTAQTADDVVYMLYVIDIDMLVSVDNNMLRAFARERKRREMIKIRIKQ